MLVPSVRLNAEVVLSAIPKVRALPMPLALIPTVDPLSVTAPVVLPAVRVDPAPDERVVLLFEAKVVNAPVDLVSVPIAVLLIPVVVVLKLVAVTKKLPAVRLKLLTPVLILEVPSPVKEIAPEVPVMFTAPAATVNPLVAVSSPLDVIVAPLVVEILPEVCNTPFSSMVNLAVPPFEYTAKALLVTPVLVSLIAIAAPVPWLVTKNAPVVALPSLVKVKAVDSPAPKVKSIFLSAVVAILLPVLYAACKPNGAPLHLTIWFKLSRQIL